MSANIYKIDPKTYELEFEEPDDTIDSLDSLVEELPDNTPRFIILNYPYTASDGRPMFPLVLIYYRPSTSRQESKMLYAGCLERFKNEVSPNKFIEIIDEDDFDDLDDRIRN
ncbi:DEKNAAC100272 [Brettanomyces naardenensis]|uniref:DEKNAAC100272 n=1 Tax=Brettanomyces naardenensis TaxID=13370 RepID=A0A448YF72_BRENA|nr:DEKNAAC100272 [Brettanomyces naardenensis]